MALIKDKTISACICGRDKKAKIQRTAKQRVTSWLGYGALAGFVFALLTYPEFLVTDLDPKGWIFLLLIGYFVIAVPYKTYAHLKEGHSFLCSVRRGFIEIV